MNTNTLMEPAPAANAKLRLFTLYADFPAGMRARRLMNRITTLAGRSWGAAAEMWKLDSVAPVGPIRDLIAQEAGESDVLLIATSAVEEPDPAILQWLESLVDWKAHRHIPGLLLGLLGDEERPVDQTHWLVAHLADFARRTQMDFSWQSVGGDGPGDFNWPATDLEKLLDRKRTCVLLTQESPVAGNVTAS